METPFFDVFMFIQLKISLMSLALCSSTNTWICFLSLFSEQNSVTTVSITLGWEKNEKIQRQLKERGKTHGKT